MVYDRQTMKDWAGDSDWRALQVDWARYRSLGYMPWFMEGFWALAVYRFQRMLRDAQPRLLWLPARIALAAFRRPLWIVTRVHLSADAEIGPGLLIPHAGPIFVSPATKMGAGCTIFHGCTVGIGPNGDGAVIGDDVFLSCYTSVVGHPTIGNGALIAANTLVLSDVPAGATAIGVPAKNLPGFKAAETPAPAPAATQKMAV